MVTEKQKANLKPPKTKTEARERGKNGGIASGKARREKKTWRELANIMLETEASDTNKEILAKFGIEPTQANLSAVLVLKRLQQALAGDVSAWQDIRDLTGNKQAEVINIQNMSSITEDIEEYANRQTKESD